MKMRRSKGEGTVQAWYDSDDGSIYIREKVGRDVHTVSLSKKEFVSILQDVVPCDNVDTMALSTYVRKALVRRRA